jgi:glycerate dehydrogenase
VDRPAIVVLDGHTLDPGDNPWDQVARLGELTVHPRTPADLILARAAGARVLLTNKTPLDAATLAALPRLGFVSVLATGYNVVDVAAAAARGVAVSNVPGYATGAVAQHVFALLLELTNAVGDHHRSVRAGEWTRAADFAYTLRPIAELEGKTLGVVGLGAIGRRVAVLAGAFGMVVLAHAPRPRPGTPEGVTLVSLEELFARSDVVSLHCPLDGATAGLVGPRLLSLMKDGAILINTARGGLLDQEAVAGALRAGKLGGRAWTS